MTEPAPPPARATPLQIVLPVLTGLGGLVVGAALTATVILAPGPATASESRLSTALESCDVKEGRDAELGDDGHTLTINNQGQDESTGISFTEVQCILDALDVPAAVESHIGQTTSMDGRQSETWDGITIAWSYHPDRGMDSVITVER